VSDHLSCYPIFYLSFTPGDLVKASKIRIAWAQSKRTIKKWMSDPRPAHGWKNSLHQQAKQRKRRAILTVAASLIVVLTFICKEVAVGELKEVSDELQAAQSNVNTQRNESEISMQIMTLSEESELDTINAVTASKDYSAIILLVKRT
jgi:hypothetical protein